MAGAVGIRTLLQIILTGLTLCTAITAFTCVFAFGKYTDQMSENFRGELQSTYLPCIRSTLDQCSNASTDKCWSYCCPPATGYNCFSSPVVGLMCTDSTSQCGDNNWCRDLADIPGTCATEVCKNHVLVTRAATWSYYLAAIGVYMDLVDIITIAMLPDAVVFKSGADITSCFMKSLAFGMVIGTGTSEFMSELEQAQCYNSDGMQLVSDAGAMFIYYAIVQVISAIFSMCLWLRSPRTSAVRIAPLPPIPAHSVG